VKLNRIAFENCRRVIYAVDVPGRLEAGRRLTEICLVVLLIVFSATPAICGPQDVVIQWRFDTDSDFRGWTVGGHIADAAVAGGVLRGRATNYDPIILGPIFEIKATPTQRVEIKMKATEAARAELFWTNTLEGKYGGFSQHKHNVFDVQGDGRFHVYRVWPFWHPLGKIIRLRLDPPNAGRFEVEWIRVVDDASTKRSATKQWEFAADAEGWRAWEDISESVAREGRLSITTSGNEPIVLSPLLSVPAAENPFVCVRMAANQGSVGRVYAVSSKRFGWECATFPVKADGRMHSYNVDVGSLRTWRDDIVMLGVQPTDVQGADVSIESIAIADGPRGPAELEIEYFGRTEGVNRAGRPAKVTCLVRNLGGEVAENIVLSLKVPDGVTVVGDARQKIDRLSLWLPKTANWTIESPTPGKVDLSLRLEGAGIEPVSAKAAIELGRPPDIAKTSYVPQPKPVKSKYEVGVFYFPGWCSMSRWRPILGYPLRKPVLGWYDEANPECADWQIKWAVEHGVTFFMVDWYWCQGNRHLEHWLHDAYMKARYRKYLKWAVMWANHNRPGTHSAEDWQKVTQYWIDNYFGMDEYYQIDNRPAVFIWAPSNIRRDLGGSQQAAQLYAMSQKMARAAGHKGIYFVAMSSHHSPDACRELKSEGYEGFTTYHGFQLARQRAGTRRFPFADVVSTGPEVWKLEDDRASGLLHMPIVDTGWSSEPWHHNKALVISGRTPELFGKLCRLAREYADQTGKRIIAVGPWNEWGEGSYIEPYNQFGFQDLDQLRGAFCEPGEYPPNLIPSDVGLGPYDLPPVEQKTAWEFNTDSDLEGWSPNGLTTVEVKGGMLKGKTVGIDPVLQGPAIQVEATGVRYLTIRMRSNTDDRAQVFWATTSARTSEKASVHFDVIGDGRFHDYQLELAKCPLWRGVVVSLRFDPTSKPDVEFAVDHVRLQ